MTRPIIGIDLGTTFSAMAWVDPKGHPRILPSAEGALTTPSVVYFYGTDACVAGSDALKMVVADPAHVARFIKRSMGEEGFTLEFFGQAYSPQELSAILLRKLKEDAEEALGEPVRDAVLTVPAYFDSAQRGATVEAGTIAGFNVVSVLNEPTAAAIAYGLDRVGQDRRFMVFDLGGGTFDVTIMRIEGAELRTLASDGNAELGGKDWDDRLVGWVADQFVARFGLDPRDEPQPYQELYERCLAAKIALSGQRRAVVPVQFRGRRAAVTVTAEEFAELCADLVEQCAETCRITLEKAGLDWADLDDVVLVGGSTRMPMIRSMLADRWGRIPNDVLSPDECVALGAAVAGVLRHRPDHPCLLPPGVMEPSTPPDSSLVSIPGLSITDAACRSLGVITWDASGRERVVQLVPEGAPLPVERRGRFATARDGATTIRVTITEGEGQHRDEVRVVGELVLDGLPPRPRGSPVDVVYRYTSDQVLEVDVLDVATGTCRQATLHFRGGLGEERLVRARADLPGTRRTT